MLLMPADTLTILFAIKSTVVVVSDKVYHIIVSVFKFL